MFSCANTVETVSEEALSGEYKVVEIQEYSTLPDHIIFSFGPLGKVSGNAGCNNFSALYQQQGKNIEFSTPMNTRKYCEGKMELEKQILVSLEKASRLTGDEKKIIVFSNDDVPLMTLIKIDQSE